MLTLIGKDFLNMIHVMNNFTNFYFKQHVKNLKIYTFEKFIQYEIWLKTFFQNPHLKDRVRIHGKWKILHIYKSSKIFWVNVKWIVQTAILFANNCILMPSFFNKLATSQNYATTSGVKIIFIKAAINSQNPHIPKFQ